MFTDVVEIDGLMASTHLLPQLISAALSGMIIDQPGWFEGRKLAGRAFTKVTDPVVSDEPAAAMAGAAIHNSKNAVRVIDNLIATLQEMRTEIEEGDLKGLEKRITDARESRINWWKERWNANTPSLVASVTKTFTAVVVMQLIEEGKLSLDDTVDTWFPEQPDGDKITVRMLLSHTSGLANFSFGSDAAIKTRNLTVANDDVGCRRDANPHG